MAWDAAGEAVAGAWVQALSETSAQAQTESQAQAQTESQASSFLEVRVRPDQVEIMEFHSHGRATELAEALRRLGLDLLVEFESPCG